jgi:hypothetical protein
MTLRNSITAKVSFNDTFATDQATLSFEGFVKEQALMLRLHKHHQMSLTATLIFTAPSLETLLLELNILTS